jgi:hypothetical protein
MAEPENFSAFFQENKKLVKDYIDTKLEIYRLRMVRLIAKSAGEIIWIIVSLFLFFLFIIFLGMVTGFWLSDITGSHVKGFGLTTLFILLVILAIALLKKTLFVNPIIHRIVGRETAAREADDADNPG